VTRSVYFGPKFDQENVDRNLALRQQEIGFNIPWWFYDAVNSTVDETYNEGEENEDTGQTTGLRWTGPILIPVLSATRTEGQRENRDGGIYVVDQVVMYIPYQQGVSAGFLPPPDQGAQGVHLRDRFLFDNFIWSPVSVVTRNLVGGNSGRRAIIALAAEQVKGDELVGQVDFREWAQPVNNV
jgi:hypothetical protein